MAKIFQMIIISILGVMMFVKKKINSYLLFFCKTQTKYLYYYCCFYLYIYIIMKIINLIN